MNAGDFFRVNVEKSALCSGEIEGVDHFADE
jgi:hypothetical protein